jgi:hypothetical protein
VTVVAATPINDVSVHADDLDESAADHGSYSARQLSLGLGMPEAALIYLLFRRPVVIEKCQRRWVAPLWIR